MSKITALLQKMKSLCNSNNGKDTFNSPVTAEEISDWEIAHNVKLCDELKEFYLFSNGMNLRIYFSTFNICPFEICIISIYAYYFIIPCFHMLPPFFISYKSHRLLKGAT